MLKKCREYLTWVQNSVLEGEISKANYEKLILELNKILVEDDGDSLVVYKFRTMQYVSREAFGNDKKGETQFL
jgi:CRISPR-associated protein Cas2